MLATTNEIDSSSPSEPRPLVCRWILTLGFYLALILLLLLPHVALLTYADDDAYIHFRIARNLLTYGAPYFNHFDGVMGSSSSAWTVVLIVIFLTFGITVKAIAFFNVVVCASVIFLGARILEKVSQISCPGILFDIISAVILLPILIYSSLGLMETPTALLLFFGGSLLIMRERALGFLLLAVSVFLRLELAVFLFGALAFGLLAKRLRLRDLLACAAGAIPFVLYDMYYFGTVVPQAIEAKSLVYKLSPTGTFISVIVGFMHWSVGRELLVIVVTTLFVCIVLAATVRWCWMSWPESGEIVICWLLPSLSIAVAYIVAHAFVHVWYIPLYAIPFIFGALLLAFRNRSFAMIAVILLYSLPGVIAFGNVVYAGLGHPTSYCYFGWGARVRQYQAVGEVLYRECPGCSLMSSEIGGLGFTFKGRIYDAAGLTCPDALKHHPMRVPEERSFGSFGAIPPRYVEETMPDYIVSYYFLCEDLFRSDVIRDRYVLKELPIYIASDLEISPEKQLVGDDHLYLFVKKGRPLPDAAKFK